jgi:hypothetical protein
MWPFSKSVLAGCVRCTCFEYVDVLTNFGLEFIGPRKFATVIRSNHVV